MYLLGGITKDSLESGLRFIDEITGISSSLESE